jgi:hypothetical protein
MTSINFHLMFKVISQSLKVRPRTGRSLQTCALILILAASTVTPALAQSQTLTWQNALAKLFGRQQQKGGTRGPSFCSVSPVRYNAMSRSGGGRLFNSSGSQRLLTAKPLMLWYGNITSIEIRNRSIPSAKPVVILIPQPKAEATPSPIPQKSNLKPVLSSPVLTPPVLNRLQYDGEALLPDQEYEIRFMSVTKSSDSQSSESSKKEVEKEAERYRFRTVGQDDRDRLNRQLQDLVAKATKTNSDPILPQVEFLLQQNLVNDAQMLISQQPNPSPELATAIAGSQNPCERKLKIKDPEIKIPATPSPTSTNP